MGKKLYSAPVSPNCMSLLMAMKEAGIDEFEVQQMNMMEGEHKSEWYLKLNPNGAVPTLEDEDFMLWESRAVATYLVNAYGKKDSVYPKDAKSRANVDFYLYFDQGKLQANIGKVLFPVLFGGQTELGDTSELDKVLKDLDGYLAGKTYLTGDNPTIADFCCLASTSLLLAAQFDLAPYKNVKAWVDKAQQQPFYEPCNAGLEIMKQMAASKK